MNRTARGNPVACGLALAGLVVTACASEDTVVELGVLEHYQDAPMIEAPATASVGVPVDVRVRTYGDGCVSLESTDVVLTADGADILPHDRRRMNQVGTQILQFLPHEASVVFDSAGPRTLRVHGRRLDRVAGEPVDEVISIALDVLVE
jgi:hypothetical protein